MSHPPLKSPRGKKPAGKRISARKARPPAGRNVKSAGRKGREITGRDYLKLVEWSDSDQCFIGSAPPLIGPACHGDDEAQVYAELCQIVEEWIALFRQDGRPLPEPTAGKSYSGKFIVRTTPEVHKMLSLRALQRGESLNGYIVSQLEAP